MPTVEIILDGTAVRVAVVPVDEGLYKAQVVGQPDIEAYGRDAAEAVAKAARRAAHAMDRQVA